MKDFKKLEKKLEVSFKNKNLLCQAFCHRSYLNENPDFKFGNNERLEFLGDAVLELVVTEHLYNNYPETPEGEHTKRLSETAKEMGLNDFLLLSKGESREKGKARQFILADTFEAFIGSLYLDQGYEACRKFIKKHLIKKLPFILKKGLFKDFKSSFQEKSQEKVGITPAYKVLKEWGPDHNKEFAIGVFLNDELVAEGGGSSKQEAEEEAARIALENKNW